MTFVATPTLSHSWCGVIRVAIEFVISVHEVGGSCEKRFEAGGAYVIAASLSTVISLCVSLLCELAKVGRGQVQALPAATDVWLGSSSVINSVSSGITRSEST